MRKSVKKQSDVQRTITNRNVTHVNGNI